VTDVRGNVDTRLAKLDRTAEWSAVILATAGLARLGLDGRISERLPFDLMLPAPGQGALAATVRADDALALDAVRRALPDSDTELTVSSERAFLRRLEGGCQVPVAAHAELTALAGRRTLRLLGRVVSLDGEAGVHGEQSAAAGSVLEAEALGTALAERLLQEGAAAILKAVRAAGTTQPVPEP
jgi:hydroxymethylbilane synthase